MEAVNLDALAQNAQREADLAPAIAEELLRFRGHLGFTDALQRELLHAFTRICKSEGEVREIGERLMRDSQYCPVPNGVYAAAAALRLERAGSERTRETYRDPKAEAKCKACDDTGFILGKDEEGRDTAELCACHPAKNQEVAHAAGAK